MVVIGMEGKRSLREIEDPYITFMSQFLSCSEIKFIREYQHSPKGLDDR